MSLKALAADYRAVKRQGGAAWDEVVQLGRAAKRAGRQQGRSAFGPKTRDVQRTVQKQAKATLWDRSASMSPLTRALFLAEHAALQRGNLSHSISVARKQEQLDGAERKRKLQSKATTLELWHTTLGQRQVDDFLAHHVAAGLQRDTLRAVPSSVSTVIEQHTTPRAEPTQAAAWASHSKSSNVSVSLQKEWAERHRMILQRDSPPINTANLESKCRYYGYCVCSTTGRQILQLRNGVLAAMKRVFHSQEKKALLIGGRIVIRLCQTGVQARGSSDPAAVEEDHWLHVSAMYLKPYRPTFTRLKRIDCPAHDDLALNRVHLQVNSVCPNWKKKPRQACPQQSQPKGFLVMSVFEAEQLFLSKFQTLHLQAPRASPPQKERQWIHVSGEVVGEFCTAFVALEALGREHSWTITTFRKAGAGHDFCPCTFWCWRHTSYLASTAASTETQGEGSSPGCGSRG